MLLRTFLAALLVFVIESTRLERHEGQPHVDVDVGRPTFQRVDARLASVFELPGHDPLPERHVAADAVLLFAVLSTLLGEWLAPAALRRSLERAGELHVVDPSELGRPSDAPELLGRESHG